MIFSRNFADPTATGPMTPELMLSVVRRECSEVSQEENVVQFTFMDVPCMLVYDTTADRMRIISGIMRISKLMPGQLEAAMEANFHSALDARYAISNNVLWAAFLHPLSSLTVELLVSAIEQVAVARITFGTDYASGDLMFGGE
jgi:hypothetical protein